MNWKEEKNIVRIMKRYLLNIGFKSIGEFQEEKLHGVDICMINKKTRRYWFIECKGFPSKNYKKGNRVGEKKSSQTLKAQRYSWITTAIGQIAIRMKQKNGKYGIALPYNPYYINKVLDIHENKTPEYQRTYMSIFRKRSKVYFFFINKKKEIWQVSPDSKKLKKLKWGEEE